jgi:hypothetical protein
MKIKNILSLLFICILFTNCKKTFVCTGTDGDGEHVFTCKNCWNSQKNTYEQEIKDKGYTNVSCVKE